MTELEKECIYCDSPRPIIHLTKSETTGKWIVTNPNGTPHHHNKGSTNMQKHYPDTAPPPRIPDENDESYDQRTSTAAPPPQPQKTSYEKNREEIQIAHKENIDTSKALTETIAQLIDPLTKIAIELKRSNDDRQLEKFANLGAKKVELPE